MTELKLETYNSPELKKIKDYLEEFCDNHADLAEKINGGYPTKIKDADGEHSLICKKNLNGCWGYCNSKAIEMFTEMQKQNPDAFKDRRGGFVEDDKVFSWAVTYFEEDDIVPAKENKFKELFNEDGSEYVYKAPQTTVPKAAVSKATPAKQSKAATPIEEMSKVTPAAEKDNVKKDKPEQIGFDFASLLGEKKDND